MSCPAKTDQNNELVHGWVTKFNLCTCVSEHYVLIMRKKVTTPSGGLSRFNLAMVRDSHDVLLARNVFETRRSVAPSRRARKETARSFASHPGPSAAGNQ